jgi:hypothetical protein
MNQRFPVAHVRFSSVDEWQIVASEAERRGVSLSALLRTLAVEGCLRGGLQTHHQTNRALATKRST